LHFSSAGIGDSAAVEQNPIKMPDNGGMYAI
jgi:hypothetical protein